MARKTDRALLVLICVVLVGCNSDPGIAGNSAETGNARIAGRVVGDPTRTVAATVTLLPHDYDPVADGELPQRYSTATDQSGAFAFDSVAPGLYNVLASHTVDGTVALCRNVNHVDAPTILSADTLRAAATLVVPVPAVESQSAYVVVTGTGYSAQLSPTSRQVVLDGLPSGVLPAVYLREQGGEREVVLADSVVVGAGDTVVLEENAALPKTRGLVLNTTPFGADIRSMITGFPLLVRLTESNFPFDSLAGGLSGLRVTRDSLTALPFEIESWCDTCTPRQATVWIRIDTVYPGRIWTAALLHYEPGTIPRSSEPVFGSGSGFVAVYHCAEQAAGLAAEIRDASGNGLHGSTGSPQSAPLVVDAVAGRGLQFDGVDDYVSVAHDKMLLPDGDMTISAWVRLHELPSVRNESAFLIAKRDSAAPWQSYYVAIDRKDNLPMFLWRAGSDSGYTTGRHAGFVVDSWYHVTVVKNGQRLTTYVNADSGNTWSMSSAGSLHLSTGPLFIGSTGGTQEQLRGVLDEVRLESIAREPAWIHLNYENQRPAGRLLSVR